MYVEPHISPYTYGSETQLIIESTGLGHRLERHGLQAPLACIVDYTLHEYPAYSPSLVRAYEADADVTL